MISLYTPLKDLDLSYTKDDNEDVRKQFASIRQNLQTWLETLNEPNPNKDVIADRFLEYVSSGYATIEYIAWLKAQDKVTFPNVDFKDVTKLLNNNVHGFAVKISPKRYLYVGGFVDPSSGNYSSSMRNFLLVGGDIVYRLTALIIENQYPLLRSILTNALTNLDASKGITDRTLENIHTKAANKLPNYSHIKIKVNILNPSNFPIAIYNYSEITASVPGGDKSYSFKSTLAELTDDGKLEKSEEGVKSQYFTHILQPNQFKTFVLTTTEPLRSVDEEIRSKLNAKALEFKVILHQRIDIFFQSGTVSSEPMRLEEF